MKRKAKNSALNATKEPGSYDLAIVVEMFRSSAELAKALQAVIADGTKATPLEAGLLQAALLEARTEFSKLLSALEG